MTGWHKKVNRERLFTIPSNVKCRGHQLKLTGGTFKTDESSQLQVTKLSELVRCRIPLW